jgi:ring-1,2-phenylacetyl-CoA epoxidase subunit PaaA
MYGNSYVSPEEAARFTATSEDPEKLAAFEARIARGEKIEPTDWMPTEYRKQLTRMIEQQTSDGN